MMIISWRGIGSKSLAALSAPARSGRFFQLLDAMRISPAIRLLSALPFSRGVHRVRDENRYRSLPLGTRHPCARHLDTVAFRSIDCFRGERIRRTGRQAESRMCRQPRGTVELRNPSACESSFARERRDRRGPGTEPGRVSRSSSPVTLLPGCPPRSGLHPATENRILSERTSRER